MNAAKLYTPEMLSAAVELAQYPAIPNAPIHGSSRSTTCGSTLEMDVVPGADGTIAQLGLLVRACAVGQAAAAIFARHAAGRSPHAISIAHGQMLAWLNGNGDAPDWPDISMIAAAQSMRGRHGAMLLPWKAAMEALSTAPASG